MADQKALAKLKELYDSGTMTPDQKASVEALSRKGVLDLGVGQTFKESRSAALREKMAGQREEVFAEQAQEVGPIQATLIGAGKGFANVGRSVGLIDPAGPTETEAIAALKKERPIATGGGELLGEAAPFVPLGLVAAEGAGAAASRAGLGPKAVRLVAAGGAGTAGGLEGALLSEDQTKGAIAGTALATGAELFIPVLGTMVGKFFRKIMGKAPKGSLLDNLGTPTAELKEALDMSGRTFEDLTEEAQAFIKSQPAGADPKQVARAALFAEEGVPISKGELTKDFAQRKKEAQLLGSGEDVAAEPFREFKLAQSEKIKSRLQSAYGADVTKSETGDLIQDALIGRKTLTRTHKNDLYTIAKEEAEKVGGIPIFPDEISKAIPSLDDMEDLAITASGDTAGKMQALLVKYGLMDPAEELTEAEAAKLTPLAVDNFQRFRKGLNAIKTDDTSFALSGDISNIIKALDLEVSELGKVLGEDVPQTFADAFQAANKANIAFKTEFDPKAFVSKITDTKKNSRERILEASEVYNVIMRKSTAPEDIVKTMASLRAIPEGGGEAAIASLQASTIMDLVEAGYTGGSRQISGIPTFNHTAFNKRLENIGNDKVKEIFKDNLPALNRINNIGRIAQELTIPEGAVPKGSENALLDLFNKLGLASISAKIPGSAFAIGAIKSVSDPIKKARFVKGSLSPVPEVLPKSTPFRAQTLGEQLQDPEAYLEGLKTVIPNNYPGILAALGIAQQSENKNQ